MANSNSHIVKPGPAISTVKWKDLTWIIIERPTQQEIQYLSQNYRFHPLDLDDCLSKVQLPKIDEYPDYLFIILHLPVFNPETRITSSSQVAMFLGRDFVVTIHSGDLKPLVTMPLSCQKDDKLCAEYLGKDSGYLTYRIVDALVDYCFPMVDKTLSNLEQIEDIVFDPKIDASSEVAILRRDIAAQRRIIRLVKGVIASLELKVQRFTQVDLKVYFGDINDHLDRLWNNLEECQETVEIFKDSDFLLSQERTNKILAILTIIFTVTLPAIVLGSFYGMNINLPGGIETGSWTFLGRYTTFYITLVIAIAPALVMLWFFRRQRWL